MKKSKKLFQKSGKAGNPLKRYVLTGICLLGGLSSYATTDNIAPQARVTVSDALNEETGAERLTDGIVMCHEQGEWACRGSVTSWGIMHMPWARLEWDAEVCIDRVVLYDRVSPEEHLAGGTLHFSDGSQVSVTGIPNDGSACDIRFPARKVKWLRFEATDGNGKNIGLSEIEVFAARTEGIDFVEWVDPYIETTRGRWFYCTPGARPMGMVAAHAFTRNKNQGGGGYNYNFPDILGFSQINEWMVSGPNLMPVTGDVDPTQGMSGWKSGFTHDSEIIRPGYHRLYLDRYRTWVEYTATDRVAFYRTQYTSGTEARLLVDVGSVLGNCSMDKGTLLRAGENRIVGEFYTTERFWGGPDSIKICFVLDCNRPIRRIDGWNEKGIEPDVQAVSGNDAGMSLSFGRLEATDTLLFKMALSYTSVENAITNLDTELPHWEFDAVCRETRDIWNETLGRIDVKGGTGEQRIKFYTDLWHALLGRHRINDVNGCYPDYTAGPYTDKRTAAPMTVRQLPLDEAGKCRFNMYGFDSIWLTQWNLNILWGLAWPEVLDDFSACLVQYAQNGGLLPRGACSGGYSFIMTGCPATNMLVSTFMKGLMKKTEPRQAYEAIKRNHRPGGMMSYESADDLNFYIRHGYCPLNAGKTMEWAFQDWGAARMASRLGYKADAREFERRSHAWTPLFDSGQGLIFPKDRKGRWLHRDPLSGAGWVEANSWQATWSLSHDLPRLISLMGGADSFCAKLDSAFRLAAPTDFVHAYSGGYVSYANQPGCSNAHLFSYGGKPWLTQYWVRRVKEQAYGGVTPDKGYGGHDEDEGQMGGVSALMALGLFSVTGTESDTPYYDITSPIFDRITIRLNSHYYSGKEFVIIVHGNSAGNCYIQRARLNGEEWDYAQMAHAALADGGCLELWLDKQPNTQWGKLKYFGGE